MKDILWVKLPDSAYNDKEKIDKFFKNELGGEDIHVIITYGNCELKFFNRRIFTYPYWLLKLKMYFK